VAEWADRPAEHAEDQDEDAAGAAHPDCESSESDTLEIPSWWGQRPSPDVP